MEIIEDQSARLSELIDELLLLAALERGQLRVTREPVRVADVLERVVAGFDAGPSIVLESSKDDVAYVNRRYLAQIVENYISNARKYGAPPITVTTTASPRWLEIGVTDCGPGVPDEFVPQLFEPFRRGGDAAGVRGSGLGLSIVRGLVEAQGGDAWYERNRPSGACFKARFPQAPDGEARKGRADVAARGAGLAAGER